MINDYIDEWGLLDKKSRRDGGDSAHREGMFFSLHGMRIGGMLRHDIAQLSSRFKDVMGKIHPHPGVIIRHCNPLYDASDWDRGSRDQMQPIIIAMGYWDRAELKKFVKGHMKRGFLFASNTRQNGATKRNHGVKGYSYAWKLPDLTGPEIWANIIRSFNAWYLWPLLCLFDLELLGGAIKWRFFRTHNISLNHTLSQMQAIDRLPTPVSWLASKIMPVPDLIKICADHLDDPYVEMPFFADMFYDAFQAIRGRK